MPSRGGGARLPEEACARCGNGFDVGAAGTISFFEQRFHSSCFEAERWSRFVEHVSGSRCATEATGVCRTDVSNLIPWDVPAEVLGGQVGPDDLPATTLDAIAARGLVVAAYL